jgi:hypothetical protein
MNTNNHVMKKYGVALLLIVAIIQAVGQNGEFKVYDNGLIYSESTIGKLSSIADSLNLRFRSCGPDRKFQSRQQSIGHLIIMKSGNIKSAARDIEAKISFEDFLLKYPGAEVRRDVLVVKWKYTNYKEIEVVEFEQIVLGKGYGSSVTTTDLETYRRSMHSEWVHMYRKKGEYADERLTAFYFPSGFVSKEIPEKYAQMIGYADCMIDTTTAKMHHKLEERWVDLPKNWVTLSASKKENLLERMRGSRVVGFCSQDSRPRMHAINIAMLSAETFKWEVFLKAHLDIMNDRFERISDGSYAWAQRQTYIRELEVLNINVRDLMFGISFRIENPGLHHYYGSISRLGRALAETGNRDEIEESMLSVIADESLDDYNRVLFMFLFLNYNYHLQDKALKQTNQEKFLMTMDTLPAYIRNEFKVY